MSVEIPTAQCQRFQCARQPSAHSAGFACSRHWLSLPRPMKDRLGAYHDGTLAVSYRQLVIEANQQWDAAGVPRRSPAT